MAVENEEAVQMTKVLRCQDVGIWECDFVARGETEQEILNKAAEHARSAHEVTEIPADVLAKVRAAIRDE